MPIEPKCDRCGEELMVAGGLAFSTPFIDDDAIVRKLHLCVDCWALFLQWVGRDS